MLSERTVVVIENVIGLESLDTKYALDKLLEGSE